MRNTDSYWRPIYAGVINDSVDFLNLSVGAAGTIEAYTEQQIRQNFSHTISAMAQTGSANKTVFVWAAANAANDSGCSDNGITDACNGNIPNANSPEIYAGMMARISELQGHSIAVVSADSSGNISGFSNRCGIAASWCIAAPGDGVRAVGYQAAEDPNNPGHVRDAKSQKSIIAAWCQRF
ncbi:MAG: S8 family serine peptidase [Acidiferrobacterales bacterium]|nr:S8 family serine peptidase [Acidiferrobacterales bacterium]